MVVDAVLSEEFLGKRYEPGVYQYGLGAHFWVESDRIDEFIATSTLRRCAWGWRRHVEHWYDERDVIPIERRIDVRYETIVRSDDAEIERISRFLGLGAQSADILATGISHLN